MMLIDATEGRVHNSLSLKGLRHSPSSEKKTRSDARDLKSERVPHFHILCVFVLFAFVFCLLFLIYYIKIYSNNNDIYKNIIE
jgi:hypothetical protein